MGRHEPEPEPKVLPLFLRAGRNTRATMATASGPDNRTIPTAVGGPPNEVTMAAIVVVLVPSICS